MIEGPVRGSKPWSDTACLWAVFLIALSFRLGVSFVLPPPSYSPDSIKYYETAEYIAQGKGFVLKQHGNTYSPLPYSEPVYTFFLAFLKIVGLGSIQSTVYAQIFIASWLAPIVYAFVRRRGSGPLALTSALIYALDPLAAGSCFFILRELLAMVVILSAVAALDWARRGSWAFQGTLMGFATLTYALMGLWSIVLWLASRRWSRGFFRVTVSAVVAAWVVAGAWMARNAILSGGHMVMRQPSVAVLLFFTSHYEFNSVPDPRTPEFQKLVDEAYVRFGDTTRVEQREYERRALAATWQKFRQEPAVVVWRFIKCNLWFWLEVPGSLGLADKKPVTHIDQSKEPSSALATTATVERISKRRMIAWGLRAFHWFQLFLMFSAFVFLWRSGDASQYVAVWVTVVYLGVFVFPFMPIPRYYVPFLPLFDILAGYGAIAWWRRLCPTPSFS